ncbi:MAG: hypothetical protein EOO15_23830 [Chitinophagaceae bacterium]|nr:MAG: hypothetical protein EOO15_23830 [Chitinophagaceae bacterium]
MSTNRSNERIPQQVIDQTKTLLLELKSLWAPYSIHLSQDEQDGLVKMADRKLPFALEVQDAARSSPGFIPAFLDVEDFHVDMENSKNIAPLLSLGRQWMAEVEIIKQVSNSEAYEAALSIYAAIRETANRQGDPIAREAAASLGRHFKRGNYRKKTEPNTP